MRSSKNCRDVRGRCRQRAVAISHRRPENSSAKSPPAAASPTRCSRENPASSARFSVPRFPNPNPGSSTMLSRAIPACLRRRHPFAQAREHQRHNLFRRQRSLRFPLRGLSARVHQHQTATQLGHCARHRLIPQHPRNIIHNLRSSQHCSPRRRRMVRIHRHHRLRPLAEHRFQHRQQPLLLLVRRNIQRTGPRRLRPQVKNVSAAIQRRHGRPHRIVHRRTRQPIAGKTIRRQVHDRHHQRPIPQRQRTACAAASQTVFAQQNPSANLSGLSSPTVSPPCPTPAPAPDPSRVAASDLTVPAPQ